MNLTLNLAAEERGVTGATLRDARGPDVSPDMSFLEMLDVVNERLTAAGQEPIVFDSDCREGICGMCSLVINGVPHGGRKGTTVCQLTCAVSRTARPSPSNRGGHGRSRR